MKQFIAIVSWDGNNRCTKFQDFDVEADATAHVVGFGGIVVSKPNGGVRDWLVDPVGKTVSVDVLPPDPGPTNDEIYDKVMRNEKVFKAFALCVNDGSIVPGSNMTNAALKAAVKAKM